MLQVTDTKLQKLKMKINHSCKIQGINDSAAAVLLASSDEIAKRNLKVLAKIIAFSQTGCEPKIMGAGKFRIEDFNSNFFSLIYFSFWLALIVFLNLRSHFCRH
jgi:hypothetical protein